MKNSRNAGRKPGLTAAEAEEAKRRWQAGESVSVLAREYGISRQALYKHFRNAEYVPARVEYYIDGKLCTLIEADLRRERVHIINYAAELSRRAFGYEDAPKWEDFLALMEDWYLKASGADESGTFLLGEQTGYYQIKESEVTSGNKSIRLTPDSDEALPVFSFTKKDLIFSRSDTDGYQLKALSADRRHFVKAQAVMAGVALRDWAVEIIACRLCGQLGIPCVEQKHCRFAYGKQVYDAVCSPNFELDGYSFISFESLLERRNRSTRDDEFIRMDAVAKLKWCAKQLAEIGELPYEKTEKYMLDLAVLDCLTANVDRHTRNFGLFFNNLSGRFEIPLVFDNGMGLFEHDHYRDWYTDYEEAMRNVYVSPYGEDPFELLEMLKEEFPLKTLYPKMEEPDYGDILKTEFATEFMERMKEAWRR